MKTLLDYARRYRYEFNWSIIPINRNSKIPMSDWKKYQNNLIPMGEVESIFKDKDLNIALVCGDISGVYVVDSDFYKTGKELEITSPLVSITPRGGKHFYYKYNEPLNSAKNIEKAIDLKSQGGYVLLPPSKINGKIYRWIQEPTIQLINSLPTLEKPILSDIVDVNKSYKKLDLSKIIGTSEGARDDSLHKATCSILNTMPEAEWEKIGLPLIFQFNQSFIPPLSEHDVMRIFNSARNFVSRNPKKNHSEIRSKLSPNWTHFSFSDRVDQVIARQKDGDSVEISSGFEKLDQILHGFQPGQSYLFFGDTNTGKSSLLVNILMNISKQKEKVMYFDLENNADMSTERMVLINELDLNKDAWRSIKGGPESVKLLNKLKELPFYLWDTEILQERFGSITFEAVETCIQEGVNVGCRVFGIDHLHYFEPSEKNFGYLADITKKINDLSSKHNIVIQLVAHTRKGLLRQKDGAVEVYRPTTDDISGSGLISRHTKNCIGIMRNHISQDPIERTKTTLFIDKTKSGEAGFVEFRFNSDNLHFTEL